MTTHDRDKVIAAAEEAGIYRLYDGISYGPSGINSEQFERFYAIAFEAGRQAEREECAIEAAKQAQDEPYGHAKFRCYNIAEAIRARSTK
jgi:hypothetical protein